MHRCKQTHTHFIGIMIFILYKLNIPINTALTERKKKCLRFNIFKKQNLA